MWFFKTPLVFIYHYNILLLPKLFIYGSKNKYVGIRMKRTPEHKDENVTFYCCLNSGVKLMPETFSAT